MVEENPYRAAKTSAATATDLRPRRTHVGIIILGILQLISGVWVAGQNIFILTDVYAGATGPVHVSNAFVAHFVGVFLFVFLAVVSAVLLFVGATWGWWLGTFYWCWRLCSGVLLPLSLAFFAAQAAEPDAGASFDLPAMMAGLLLFGLPLLYLHKASVRSSFRISSAGGVPAILWPFGAASVLSIVVSLIRVALQ